MNKFVLLGLSVFGFVVGSYFFVKRGVLEPVKKLRELQLSAIEERERQPKFTSLESLNEYILGKKGEEKFARKLKLDVVARNIRIASRTPISDVVGKGVERKVLGAVLPFISKDKVDKVASTLGKFRDKTKAVIGVAVAETVERPLQDLELYKAGKFLKKSIGFAGEVVEKIGERFPKVGKVLKFTGKGASVSIASAYAGGGGGVYAGGSAGVGGCSSAGNGTVGGKGLNAINETGSGGGGGDGGNGGGDGGSGIIIISFISSSTLNITDSSYNLTSDGGCSVWNTSKSNVCNTTDGTPNIVFDTNFNANCSFSTTSGNYNSSLICSTTDSTSHSCNIYYAERLAYGLDSLYASCYDGTTQVTSGALAINMTAGTPGNVTTSCTVDYGNWRFIPNGCVI